jgi:hypothetical protein
MTVMFCPQCSQQNLPDARFCSRCGLQLEAVARALAAGGGGETAASPYAAASSFYAAPAESAKRRGARQGVMIIVWSLAMAPLLVMLATLMGGRPQFAIASCVFACLGGILRLLYALLFERSAPMGLPAAPAHVYAPPQPLHAGAAPQGYLPPQQQQGVPAGSFAGRGAQTSEIVSPPSVTEHTTTLFNKPR